MPKVTKAKKDKMKFTYITSSQMTDVDKFAVKQGLPILEMMERAGKNLALFVKKLKPSLVWVLYGKGNNGGGGLVAARYLKELGIDVAIISATKEMNKNVKYQLNLLQKFKIRKDEFEFNPGKKDIIIDALLGYNIQGDPRGKYAHIINKANKFGGKGIKIISLDLPSGLNPDTGESYNPVICPNYIFTLALPKIGLKRFKNVYLVNIGILKKVYSDLGIKVGNYFKDGDIVKVN